MIEKSGTLGTTILMQDEAGHLIGEYTSTGALVEETVWMGDIPVATLQPNGSGGINIFYVHTDHLNTPRKVSRPSDNQLEWRWDTDPFGATAANQNPVGLGTFVYDLRFPGQMYQAETGLSQNLFRDYDSAVGRYVENDPIGLNGGINTYAYVSGNPISSVDMLGLLCRKGERILRNEMFKDLSSKRELGKLEIPFIGPVHAEAGVSPEFGPNGIRLNPAPSLSWDIIYFVWERDQVTTGYVQSKFFSRKYYCTSDDSCGNKQWVEIRDDGFEQSSFFNQYNEWNFVGTVPSGYKTAMP